MKKVVAAALVAILLAGLVFTTTEASSPFEGGQELLGSKWVVNRRVQSLTFSSVTASDLDADGKVDLVAVGYPTEDSKSSGLVLFLRNLGSRRFEIDYVDTLAALPWCVKCADLDGDGDQDVVVANNGSGDLVLYRNNDLDFRPEVILTLDGLCAVDLGDLDADGATDIVIATAPAKVTEAEWAGAGSSGTAEQQLRHMAEWISQRPASTDQVGWCRNEGGGSFSPAELVAEMPGSRLGAMPVTLRLGDLDGDNDIDIAIGSRISGLRLLVSNGDQTFQTIVADERGVSCIELSDIDLDGVVDVIAGMGGGDESGDRTSVECFTRDGSQGWRSTPLYTVDRAMFSISAGDIDRNGDVDVLSTQSWVLTDFDSKQDRTLALAETKGGMPLSRPAFISSTVDEDLEYPLSGFVSPMSSCLTDIDGDGYLDLVVAGTPRASVFYYARR